METNAKEIEILPKSITGPRSLAVFTLIESDFITGFLLPNSPAPSQMRTQETGEVQRAVFWKVVPHKPLVFLCIMTVEYMSLLKTLSVQLLMLNSSQNFYCFLPLAPILSLFLAVRLASGFVGDMHQSWWHSLGCILPAFYFAFWSTYYTSYKNSDQPVFWELSQLR